MNYPSISITLKNLIIVTVLGCSFVAEAAEPKIGDCLMPKSGNGPQEIIKVIGVTNSEYRVFTHFLSNGKLIQAQDYASRTVMEVNKNYIQVECPATDGTFSPDKYLSKKNQ